MKAEGGEVESATTTCALVRVYMYPVPAILLSGKREGGKERNENQFWKSKH